MRIWKFVVPDDRYYPLPGTDVSFRGCVAVAIAETEAAAREIVVAQSTHDTRWLPIAKVASFPVTEPRLLALAMI
jgi:hypothetical protein